MFNPTDKMGPYILMRRLGTGGFGEVWLAEKRTLIATTQVAIKFPTNAVYDLSVVQKEAAVWARASGHTNVLPMIEADIYDDQLAIVSEYAPDGSLRDWLKRNDGRTLSLATVVEMVSGILAGLEHLHKKAIVHRDLKPDNILLQGETPRLADFGLSRVLTNTQSSTVSGTFAFMAPEVFRRVRNEQGDLWAVGVMLYLMVSGTLPFAESDHASMMHSIMTDEPPPLSSQIPMAVRGIVGRALMKDTNKRFKTASEMRQALREVLNVELPTPMKSTEPGIADARPAQVMERSVVLESDFDEPLAGRMKLAMVMISGGSFMMGSTNDQVQARLAETERLTGKAEPDGFTQETPQHQVTVSNFYIGKFQVTQAQWRLVANWPEIQCGLNPVPSYYKGDELPVEQVSWEEAVEFCARVSRMTGRKHRLPTEAEWEYAARGGMDDGFTGNLDEMAWYSENSDGRTHPVGLKKINDWGLSDMLGNVWEWCHDWYESDYYQTSPVTDPQGPGNSQYRVLRGGSWTDLSPYCRAACRYGNAPGNRDYNFGFRVVMIV